MIFLALNFLSNHGLSCLQKLDSSGLCRDFHCPVVHNIEDKSRMWIQRFRRTTVTLEHLFTFTNRFSILCKHYCQTSIPCRGQMTHLK